MATLFGLLAISVSVGLSNFAGAIGIGLAGIDARTRVRVGIAFGLFEALMPLAGLLVGRSVTGLVGTYSGYFAAGLLILTGAYTIWQGRRVRPEAITAAPSSSARLLVTALALSIDNLAVGFALGVYRVPVVLAAITMGVVSVAMSLIGLELGHRLGARVEAWSEELSGAVLVLLGLALGFGLIR